MRRCWLSFSGDQEGGRTPLHGAILGHKIDLFYCLFDGLFAILVL